MLQRPPPLDFGTRCLRHLGALGFWEALRVPRPVQRGELKSVITTKQWVRYHDVSSPRWSAFRIRGYRRRPAAAADFDSRVSAPPALWIASVEVSEAEKILITSFIYTYLS